MPFKLGILILLFSLTATTQAAEKEALPMDLIELLGELEEDDLESLDEELLNATLHDAKTSTSPQTNAQKRTTTVGGQ